MVRIERFRLLKVLRRTDQNAMKAKKKERNQAENTGMEATDSSNTKTGKRKARKAKTGSRGGLRKSKSFRKLKGYGRKRRASKSAEDLSNPADGPKEPASTTRPVATAARGTSRPTAAQARQEVVEVPKSRTAAKSKAKKVKLVEGEGEKARTSLNALLSLLGRPPTS